MLVILALWKLRQEVPEFEVSRGSVVRLGLKKKRKEKKFKQALPRRLRYTADFRDFLE